MFTQGRTSRVLADTRAAYSTSTYIVRTVDILPLTPQTGNSSLQSGDPCRGRRHPRAARSRDGRCQIKMPSLGGQIAAEIEQESCSHVALARHLHTPHPQSVHAKEASKPGQASFGMRERIVARSGHLPRIRRR
jgi:hypothetical protein